MAEPVTFKFGKFNGRPISDANTPYLEWLLGVDEKTGQPRCSSRWFADQIRHEIARRTGGDHEPPPEHREPIREAVRVHPNAPPGSQQYMGQSKLAIDMQRLFTTLATINAKLDDILTRLGEPVAAGADGNDDDIAF
jgi:hypothetical protein